MKSKLPRRDVLKFMLLASAGGLVLPGNAPSASAAELPTGQPFSHPHRIRYDGKSLFVEDKPFFLCSGCFHYYRCPKPMWRTCVATRIITAKGSGRSRSTASPSSASRTA